MARNKDPSFINGLQREDAMNIFVTICDSSLSAYDRLKALNSLFDPRITSKFPLYERCELFQCFEKVMDDSQRSFKDTELLHSHMLSQYFLCAVVMNNSYDATSGYNGGDGIDELYALELPQLINIWERYFAMIQHKHCHIEFIRHLFRVFH